MYISLEEYAQLYDPMEEHLFNRLCVEACRVMDDHTTGIDGVRKLRRFFPTEELDAQAVKHCTARLVNTLYQFQQAEAAAAQGRGYETTEQGLRGRVISSVSAGNESISYATGGSSTQTAIDQAVKDPAACSRLMKGIVLTGLRGVPDANGVNLLYMANYPRRYLC